jgi:hypothetical protein
MEEDGAEAKLAVLALAAIAGNLCMQGAHDKYIYSGRLSATSGGEG